MLRLTRHGLWEMILGALLLLLIAGGLVWLWPPASVLPLLVLIWLFSFFRDPERKIPDTPGAMVSPADGMVSDITEIAQNEHLGEPCLRVGIFLSVFNVHINRSPCDAKVMSVTYQKGKFINALHHDEASEQNESNTLLLADDQGPVAVVKQIVGLIARRIVCTAKPGDHVTRGQRIGMIKFGSRTELYLPISRKPRVMVQVGQKVRGAADVIAVLDNVRSPRGQATMVSGDTRA